MFYKFQFQDKCHLLPCLECTSALKPILSKLSEASSKKALSGSRISRPSWPAGAARRAREPVRKSFCMSITRKAEPECSAMGECHL